MAKTAAIRIIVLPVLVAHLPAIPSAAKLPALLKSCVPVCSQHAVVELRSIDKLHAVLGIRAPEVPELPIQ